jgi:hypothetical protein
VLAFIYEWKLEPHDCGHEQNTHQLFGMKPVFVCTVWHIAIMLPFHDGTLRLLLPFRSFHVFFLEWYRCIHVSSKRKIGHSSPAKLVLCTHSLYLRCQSWLSEKSAFTNSSSSTILKKLHSLKIMFLPSLWTALCLLAAESLHIHAYFIYVHSANCICNTCSFTKPNWTPFQL